MIIDHFSEEIQSRLIGSKKHRDHRTAYLKLAYAPLFRKDEILHKIAKEEIFHEMRAIPKLNKSNVKTADLDQEKKGLLTKKAKGKGIFSSNSDSIDLNTDRPLTSQQTADSPHRTLVRSTTSDKMGKMKRFDFKAHNIKKDTSKTSVKLPKIASESHENLASKSSKSLKSSKLKLKIQDGERDDQIHSKIQKRNLQLPSILIQPDKPNSAANNMKQSKNLKKNTIQSPSNQIPILNANTNPKKEMLIACHNTSKSVNSEIRLTAAFLIRKQHLLDKQKAFVKERRAKKKSGMQKFIKQLVSIGNLAFSLPASSPPFLNPDLRLFRKQQLEECDMIHDYLRDHGIRIKKKKVIDAIVVNEDLTSSHLPKLKIEEQAIPKFLSFRLNQKIQTDALNELLLGKEFHKVRSIILNEMKEKAKNSKKER